jgi:aminopeptidase N
MRFLVISFFCCSLFVASAEAQQRSGGYLQQEKSLMDAEARRHQVLTPQNTVASLAGDSYDVTYYRLNLRMAAGHSISAGLWGEVTVSAFVSHASLDTFVLDLMKPMTVDSVRVEGVPSSFEQDPVSVRIALGRGYGPGERVTVDVFYEGIPHPTEFGSFEIDTGRTPAWVWSLSEPYGARDWWPCKNSPGDKSDSADIIVTCDSTFKVGSNGKLISVLNNEDGTSTWHWAERYPISSYLISVALTNFASFSNWFKYSPTDSMEILNFVLPEDLSQARANLPKTVDMLTIYSRLFGLYPFIKEKYGHSEFGWGGGMEHQTMTSVSASGFGEYVISHELAHQWFGDMITCRTWSDIWLHEGFAVYCTGLYYEKEYGVDSYRGFMEDEMSGAKSGVGTIFVQDTTSVGNIFNGNLEYQKGATVLHMLRHVLGDSTFFHAMYNYANTPALRYSTAMTQDFKAACENVSGKNLDYFFNEWIYGENYPQYTYSWSSHPSSDSYTVTVRVRQGTGTANPPFFTMPVDLKFASSGWDTVVTVFNDSQQQSFTVGISHDPTSVLLDSDGWILKDAALVPDGVLRPAPVVSNFSLEQNYPNPFNPSTVICYQIPKATRVTIIIYNLLGAEVAMLVDGHQESGDHSVIWNGVDRFGHQVASGIYLYKIEAGTIQSAKKMVYLR